MVRTDGDTMKRIVVLRMALLVMALLGLLLPAISSAAPFESWEWINPLPQGNDLYGVTYGNGTVVAVGHGGAIITSTDGIVWSKRVSGTDKALFGVTFGNGVFVAVGEDGVLTSPDGVNWTSTMSGSSAWITGVTCQGSLFVATTYYADTQTGGGILTSSDGGVTWTEAYFTDYGLWGVSYGSDRFVAVGYGSLILTSPNGVDWAPVESQDVFVDELRGITYGQGIFVAVGHSWDANEGLIITSPDGIGWTRYSTGQNETLNGITYGGTMFVAVSDQGAFITSPVTGATWTRNPSGQGYLLYGAAFAGNGAAFTANPFIAVGSQGALFTSSNGLAWTEKEAHGAWTLRAHHPSSLARRSELFLAPNTLDTLLRSPDGVAWTLASEPVAWNGSDIIYAQNRFLRIGLDGRILGSPDGVVWTQLATITDDAGAPFALTGITFGRDLFAVTGQRQTDAGSYGSVFTSRDAMTWTRQWSGVPGDGVLPGKIAYGNGVFVAVIPEGPNGENSLTSADGTNWNLHGIGGLGLAGIAFGSNIFSAYTGFNQILTSPDGVEWATAHTLSDPGVILTFSSIRYINNTFIALGNYEENLNGTIVMNSYVITSADGVSWTQTRVAGSRRLDAVEYGYGGFVAIGEAGSIIRAAAPASYRLTLRSGWNFISFLRLPSASTPIETVFNDVLPKILITWGYDNERQAWQKYLPGNPDNSNTLLNIEAGKGYWVYVTEGTAIDMSAWNLQATTVHLSQNWNLVGYVGPDGRAISEALEVISGHWSMMWGWTEGLWSGKHPTITELPVPSLVNLYQNRAYWIKAKEAVDWAQ